MRSTASSSATSAARGPSSRPCGGGAPGRIQTVRVSERAGYINGAALVVDGSKSLVI
jgi:hypothetical protein